LPSILLPDRSNTIMPTPSRKNDSQARACAHAVNEILWTTLAYGRPTDRALNAFLRANKQYGSRDRRLTSHMVFAVLRWWGWLARLAPRPFQDALKRVGANPDSYQQRPEPAPQGDSRAWSQILLGAHVLENSHRPDIARVWAGHIQRRSPKPFTEDDALPFRARELAKRLGVNLAGLREGQLVPKWAAAEIPHSLPKGETLSWLQRRPPVWLRAQTDAVPKLLVQLRKAELEPERHAQMARAIRIGHPRTNLRTLDSFRKGAFEVQDLASQVVAHVCAPKPGQRWWDACAGAGGKTLHLADLMQSKGTVLATDIRTRKLEDLRKRARRAGFSNIQCREWRGDAVSRKRATFDGILVDAPCTCSGTWRRNPDGRWTTSLRDVTEMAERQLGLLTSAATGLRSGGIIVYATCSMFAQENTGVVEAFLAKHAAFALDPFTDPLTGKNCDGTRLIAPWEGDCDTMFVARFRHSG